MNFAEVYEATLPIVATEVLIMGITLLSISGKNGTKKQKYRLGIRLIGVAMLLLSVINYAEQFIPFHYNGYFSVSAIVFFTASTQLFLLLYAYMALINIQYITKRKIAAELAGILFFTTPPLLINSETQPETFHILFYISLSYYLIKLIANIVIFRKAYNKVQAKLQDYYSDGDKKMLNWVCRTFQITLIMGCASVIVPLTNITVLTVYQVLLFFTYLYIYWKVIRHELIFNDIISLNCVQNARSTVAAETASTSEATTPKRLFTFDKWIAERHYAKAGTTIDDVAVQLKTTRTTLSLYLNSELRMNFYEWISKIRIENAQRILIENPAMPIADVATHVGIDDRSNFDKLFKRIAGISPSNYRIKHAKELLKEE